jgi:hypothetical protein
MMQANPKGKFVPHKVLREGWTYFSVSDSDYVVGVKVSITKVMRLEGTGGAPAIGPDGTPAYFFNSTNIVKTLTNAEWKVLKQQGEFE